MIPKLTSLYFLMAVGHHWHVCKLMVHFLQEKYFFGRSMFVSIDHVILDFPIISVVSYTCAITL